MTWIYAHRGDSAHHTENTREAFLAALAAGADGIETDLRLARDGCIVLNHDRKLPREGSGSMPVRELDCSDLARRHGETGRPLMTLDAFWKAFSGRVRLNLEVKEKAVFAPLTAFLKKRDVEGILVTSRLWPPLVALKKEVPGLWVGPVVEGAGEAQAALKRDLPFDVVSLNYNIYTTVLATFAMERNRRLFVWTVNDPAEAIRLVGPGVAAILTDDPGGLRAGMRTALRGLG